MHKVSAYLVVNSRQHILIGKQEAEQAGQTGFRSAQSGPVLKLSFLRVTRELYSP